MKIEDLKIVTDDQGRIVSMLNETGSIETKFYYFNSSKFGNFVYRTNSIGEFELIRTDNEVLFRGYIRSSDANVIYISRDISDYEIINELGSDNTEIVINSVPLNWLFKLYATSSGHVVFQIELDESEKFTNS